MRNKGGKLLFISDSEEISKLFLNKCCLIPLLTAILCIMRYLSDIRSRFQPNTTQLIHLIPAGKRWSFCRVQNQKLTAQKGTSSKLFHAPLTIVPSRIFSIMINTPQSGTRIKSLVRVRSPGIRKEEIWLKYRMK